MGKATQTIRAKRQNAVNELPDWEALREAGRAIKEYTLRHLDEQLLQLEESVTRAGGQVHWASDAAEANQIIARIVRGHGASEVIKVKSLTTDEIRMNEALAEVGVTAIETDLAELIIQLANEESSHILVPAIHKNRAEIRELFMRTLGAHDISDSPAELAGVARRYLRTKFLSVPVATSGANFAVAETGTIAVVESEGNGRMCLTLPKVLISIMGIEKIIPTWQDFEVFAAAAALLDGRADEPATPRSGPACIPATGRRSSTWCCSTTGARRCWPTRSAARRSTVSAAAPA